MGAHGLPHVVSGSARISLLCPQEPMSLPLQRAYPRDCNSDKCSTSTAYDLTAQDTTAAHGKGVQGGNQEGGQNTLAYVYVFQGP